MGALLTSVILLVGSTLVIIENIPKVFAPEKVNYDGMLVLGIFAMVGGILFYAHQASEQNQTGAVVVTTTQATQSPESTPSPTQTITPLPSTAPLPTSKPLGTATHAAILTPP